MTTDRNDEPFIRQPDGNDDGIDFSPEDPDFQTCPHGIVLTRNERGVIPAARFICDVCRQEAATDWKNKHPYNVAKQWLNVEDKDASA